MRLPKTLLILLIITLTSSWGISMAHSASSASKEYDLEYLGMNFHMNVIIQTESDGTWKVGNTYQIDYAITITYIDESQLNKQDYSLFVYEPWLWVNDYSAFCNVVTNSAVVWFGNSGTLTLTYAPTQKGTEKLQFRLSYEILKDNQVWTPYVTNAPSASWLSPDPVSINVEEENSASPNYVNPLLFIAIGVAVVSISVGTYFIYKSKKPKT